MAQVVPLADQEGHPRGGRIPEPWRPWAPSPIFVSGLEGFISAKVAVGEGSNWWRSSVSIDPKRQLKKGRSCLMTRDIDVLRAVVMVRRVADEILGPGPDSPIPFLWI